MTTLYIANCSKQINQFNFRAPGQDRIVYQNIKPGEQQFIWKENASLEDLQFIISQHEMYGLVPASDVMNNHQFVGLCYQFDKPIDVDKIMYTFETNDDKLKERNETIRKESASALAQQMAESGEGRLAEVQVIEEDKGDGNSTTTVNETIQVTGDAAPKRGRGRPRQG
jgi:hypothetical protein